MIREKLRVKARTGKKLSCPLRMANIVYLLICSLFYINQNIMLFDSSKFMKTKIPELKRIDIMISMILRKVISSIIH